MPTFNSKGGKWTPAHEVVGLVNMKDTPIEYEGKQIQPGEPFVYRGPDREAQKMLGVQDVKYLGQDFKKDPDFRQVVRDKGYGHDVDQYLDDIGYNEEETNKALDKQASKNKAHTVPDKHKGIKELAGGRDTSGDAANNIVGGFGDEKLTPAKTPAK